LGSAISPNQSVAPMIVLMLLIPQILFGGGVLPIQTFGAAGQFLNNSSLTKWPFETLVTLTAFGKDVATDEGKDPNNKSCWALEKEKRDLLTKDQKKDCNCLGENVFKQCNFAGVKNFYKPAIDEPEPAALVQPKLSDTPTQAEQQAYQKDIKAYQDNIKPWNEKYKNWNLNYNRAINEAEGNINGLREKFGQAFNVNVPQHLLILTVFVSAMLALIVAAQKVKDFI
jgi:ABC transport system ATP-binding/permease protein